MTMLSPSGDMASGTVPSQLGIIDSKNISLPENNSFQENVKDITHYYLNQVEVIPDQGGWRPARWRASIRPG